MVCTVVLGRPILGFITRSKFLFPSQTVRFSSHPIESNTHSSSSSSYRYWKLNPDQATVDPKKSPGDPIGSDANANRVETEGGERLSGDGAGPSGSSVDGDGGMSDSPV